jgi:hypothetical protein
VSSREYPQGLTKCVIDEQLPENSEVINIMIDIEKRIGVSVAVRQSPPLQGRLVAGDLLRDRPTPRWSARLSSAVA